MKRIATIIFASVLVVTAHAGWRGAFDDAYFAQPVAAVSTSWPYAGDITNDLFGWWMVTTNGTDWSTNNSTLTLVGSPTSATGKPQPCLNFDYIDDYCYGPTTLMNNPANGTLMTWVYFSVTGTQAYVWSFSTMVGKGSQYLTWGRWPDTLKMRMMYYDGTQRLLDGDFVLTNNAWYHVAITWNTTNSWWYVDGQSDGNSTIYSPAKISAAHLNGSFWIGKNASGSQLFGGILSDLRYYDRPLTSNEVFTIYNLYK